MCLSSFDALLSSDCTTKHRKPWRAFKSNMQRDHIANMFTSGHVYQKFTMHHFFLPSRRLVCFHFSSALNAHPACSQPTLISTVFHQHQASLVRDEKALSHTHPRIPSAENLYSRGSESRSLGPSDGWVENAYQIKSSSEKGKIHLDSDKRSNKWEEASRCL